MIVYDPHAGISVPAGNGHINFKHMPGGCWRDFQLYLIHVRLDFFFLCWCYPGDYFQKSLRVSCDHTCTQCSCDSAHSACVWNDYAFYVLDNVPAYLDVHLIGQTAKSFSCHCSCVGDGDWFRAAHCGNQFFFQDFYIILIFFITFQQCFVLSFKRQW